MRIDKTDNSGVIFLAGLVSGLMISGVILLGDIIDLNIEKDCLQKHIHTHCDKETILHLDKERRETLLKAWEDNEN